MKSKKKWNIFTGILLAGMVVLMLWKGESPVTISIAVSIATAIIVMVLFKQRFPEKYIKDERTNKLSAYAASWSWMVTFLLVAALYWVDYLKLIELNVTAVLGIIFAAMGVSLIAFKVLFSRKEDLP